MLDAATPNTGTMPSGAFASTGAHVGAGTDASGAETVRDATDVAGASNPDIDATGTAAADTNAQVLELRRFVSRPLAAHTFTSSDGAWTHSYARGESNTNHSGRIDVVIYLWRPSTGARVGTIGINLTGTAMAATAETADSKTAGWSGGASQAILDGDILVFEVADHFTQSMGVAYTSFYSYDGTTEASTTTCASFVTPDAPLTLFSGGPELAPSPRPLPFQAQGRNL